MEYIMALTDHYLTDHDELNRVGDERKYWERLLQAKFADDDSLLKQPVPDYLTPDKNRGIEYSDEILEMKGKITLEAKQDDPAVEYANDSFAYNEELQPINKIGTSDVSFIFSKKNICKAFYF